MMVRKILLMLMLVIPAVAVSSSGIEKGEGMFVFDSYAPFSSRPVNVHYYIPPCGDMSRMPVIFVFHGADRGYDYLMRTWKVAADSLGFMMFIPHFDKERFPLCDYQEVGVMDRSYGRIRDTDSITPVLIDRIFEHVKRVTGSRRTTFNVYGHSAGGQFIHRMMLFHDSPYIDCAVVGSPGWYTFPDTTQVYPYGIKNVPYVTQERVKKFLSKNIVVQLAPCDSVREWFLRKTPEADMQGRNRYERGLSFWNYCRGLAARYDCRFNWRKAEVPETGHISEAMGMAAVPYLVDIKQEPDAGKLNLSSGEEYMSGSDVMDYMSELKERYGDEVVIDTVNSSTPMILLSRHTTGIRKAKVWMQGALHGNEPAGAKVLCMVARHILESRVLDFLDVAIVPVANPEGYSRHMRTASGGMDLNRDFTKLLHTQTVALSRAFSDFSPDIAVDLHEYNPLRKEFASYFGKTMETDYDVLFLPTGHPNVDTGIKSLADTLFIPSAREALRSRLYSSDIYFTPSFGESGDIMIKRAGESPRSTSTRWGLSNVLPMFIEIKGLGLGPTSFQRRVECGLIVVEDILKTLCGSLEKTLAVVDEARRRSEDRCPDAVVRWKLSPDTTEVRLEDRISGCLESAVFLSADAMKPVARLVRRRPDAYIVEDPDGKICSRLAAMGIEWNRLEDKKQIKVETYRVEEMERATEKWEGIYPVEVTTTLGHAKRKMGRNHISVPVGQKLGNMVVTLLEPESPQGFVNFGIIPAEKGKELPIYRVTSFEAISSLRKK